MSEPASEQCVFCAMRLCAAHERTLENQVLLELSDLQLVPALGPLTRGHAIVVPISHGRGLLTESRSVRDRYRTFAASLRSKLAAQGDDLLEVEHGMADSRSLGPCISHTHVHLLPATGLRIADLEGSLPPRPAEARGAYVWVADGTSQRLFDAQSLRGQGTRQLLAEHLGVQDWDWALFPKYDLIRESIEYWRHLI